MPLLTNSLLILAFVILCLLAVGDFAKRRLSNKLTGLYTLAFIPAAWVAGLSPAVLGQHFGVAVVGFLVLLLLFAFRVMAGGDVKLGIAVLLWAGPGMALQTVAVIAWSGGLLAVLGWLADRRVSWPRGLCFLAGGLSARRGVPYGVALALGGIYVLWQHYRIAGAT